MRGVISAVQNPNQEELKTVPVSTSRGGPSGPHRISGIEATGSVTDDADA
jgi:hypothetical protein